VWAPYTTRLWCSKTNLLLSATQWSEAESQLITSNAWRAAPRGVNSRGRSWRDRHVLERLKLRRRSGCGHGNTAPTASGTGSASSTRRCSTSTGGASASSGGRGASASAPCASSGTSSARGPTCLCARLRQGRDVWPNRVSYTGVGQWPGHEWRGWLTGNQRDRWFRNRNSRRSARVRNNWRSEITACSASRG
jgi:hypothetical protein